MSFNQEVADYIERITAKARERYDEERNKVDGLVDSVFRSGDDAPEPAFDRIAPKLGQFAHGHPASCEHMIEKLELAADALRRNLDDEIADVRIKLEGWQGPAAVEFAEYLGDFEAAATTQLEYIEAMRVLADAQRQVLENTRTDFLTIVS